MPDNAYRKFAEEHARHVGGDRLFAAMLNQVQGQDEDVAEINWRVQGYGNTEVFANISADCDQGVLRFSVDERHSTDREFLPSLEFSVWVKPGGLVLEAGGDIINDEALALEKLAEFSRIAGDSGEAES